MKKLIKQFFCSHSSIKIDTKVLSTTPLFMISSMIQCNDCEKTFSQHPHAQCCYVNHLHGEMMREQLIREFNNPQLISQRMQSYEKDFQG